MEWKEGDTHALNEAMSLVYSRGVWWLSEEIMIEAARLDKEFVAYDDDILLASFPKTGTTWLKTIILCIRNLGTTSDDLIEREEAHAVAPCIEIKDVERGVDSAALVERLARPRFYQTHMPLHCLPKSIVERRCRIVYVTRNPKDTIVSLKKFADSMPGVPRTIGETTEEFLDGTIDNAPFPQHVLGYWQASRDDKSSNPVLFLYYEELLADPVRKIQQVAEFIGRSLSDEEAEEVARRCSFNSMKSLAPNRGVSETYGFDNRHFFSSGKAGTWRNHMSKEQSQQVDDFVHDYFDGSGVEFNFG